MKKKVYLLEICLFLLVLCNEVLRIRFFALQPYTVEIVDFVQIFIYIMLFYVIVRKKYPLKQLLICGVIGVILLIGYMESGKAAYFRGLLLILAARDIPYERILKTIFYAMSVGLGSALFLYFIGVSPDTVNKSNSLGLGYGNPNQSAQVLAIMYILYFSWKGYEKKREKYIWSLLISVLIMVLTTSRTAAIIVILAPVLMDIVKIILEKFYDNQFIKNLMRYSQAVVMIFTYVTAMTFADSKIVQALDLVFTNRIFLNWYALKANAISLFGQNLELRITGVYNEVRDIYNITTTVDCTYVMSLLILGLIPTIVFMLGYVLVIDKAWKNKDGVVLTMSLLLTLYAFSESQLTEVYVFFVYFYILTTPMIKGEKESIVI